MLKAGITLYFVRHGETDWNLAQRYQGRQDIPINATGRLQAKHNGLKLAAALGARAATLARPWKSCALRSVSTRASITPTSD